MANRNTVPLVGAVTAGVVAMTLFAVFPKHAEADGQPGLVPLPTPVFITPKWSNEMHSPNPVCGHCLEPTP